MISPIKKAAHGHVLDGVKVWKQTFTHNFTTFLVFPQTSRELFINYTTQSGQGGGGFLALHQGSRVSI